MFNIDIKTYMMQEIIEDLVSVPDDSSVGEPHKADVEEGSPEEVREISSQLMEEVIEELPTVNVTTRNSVQLILRALDNLYQ